MTHACPAPTISPPSLFPELPVAVSERLLAQQQRRPMPRLQGLTSFEGRFVAFVESGWYRVSRFGASGSPNSVTLCRGGDWIGLEAILGSDSLVTEVLTLVPGQLLLWPEEAFSELAHTDASLALAAARALLRAREREIERQRLAHSGHLGRCLAGLLLELAREVGATRTGAVRVNLPLHQHELAEVFAVRRETISLKFSELEALGALERSGRDLIVHPARLEAYLTDAPDGAA